MNTVTVAAVSEAASAVVVAVDLFDGEADSLKAARKAARAFVWAEGVPEEKAAAYDEAAEVYVTEKAAYRAVMKSISEGGRKPTKREIEAALEGVSAGRKSSALKRAAEMVGLL